MRASPQYVAMFRKPTTGMCLSFAPSRRSLDPHSEDTLGWGRLALGGVTTIEIEGDHLSMLTHPQVEAVADRLESELRVWELSAQPMIGARRTSPHCRNHDSAGAFPLARLS